MARISLIILYITLIFAAPAAPIFADEQTAALLPTPAANNPVESDAARQLRIYKTALFQGPAEQNRVDAAIELLRRADKDALEVLMQAILVKDNPEARRAVCKGLIKSRTWADQNSERKRFLEPLIGMLIDCTDIDAKLAAEALVIFDYKQIADRLKKLVENPQLAQSVRLNVIYALRMWPDDKDAIDQLMALLDDADPQVAAAAEIALQEAFGIPEGTDRQDLRSIVKNLQQKKPIEIIRDLLRAQREKVQVQNEQMLQLQNERDRWQKLYITVLDKEYESSDDTLKGKILVEKISSDLAPVKLWALTKVPAYIGPQPEGLRPGLLTLISDSDKNVRLQAAVVLTKMSALDPAEKLLEQLKVEKEPTVALAIFNALGEAVFFASSPNSKITLAPEIKTQTLALAGQYTADPDSEKAKKGADVIRKLLELNGLQPQQLQSYLDMLLNRFNQAKENDKVLAADLLNSMARLCALTSGSSEAALKTFQKSFTEALDSVDNTQLREAAVTGIVNVHKTAAFTLLKSKGFADDTSPNIRKTVIGLASQYGTVEDLEWLKTKLTAQNGESETVWQAMVEILKRQDASVIETWADNFPAAERSRELLEIAEKKAEAEKNTPLLFTIRKKLLDYHIQKKQYEKVITYGQLLLSASPAPEQPLQIQLILLDSFLATANNAEIAKLITQRLQQTKDLPAEDPFVVKLDAYIKSPDTTPNAKKLLIAALATINRDPQQSPQWSALLKTWQSSLQSAPPPTPDTDTSQPTAANN